MEEYTVVRVVHNTPDFQEILPTIFRKVQKVGGYGYNQIIAHFEDCTFFADDFIRLDDAEKEALNDSYMEGQRQLVLAYRDIKIIFNYNI